MAGWSVGNYDEVIEEIIEEESEKEFVIELSSWVKIWIEEIYWTGKYVSFFFYCKTPGKLGCSSNILITANKM